MTGFVGMNAGRAEQPERVLGALRLYRSAICHRGGGQYHMADTGRPGPFEYRFTVLVKGGVKQVDADIDPFHGSGPAQLRRGGLAVRGLPAKSLRGGRGLRGRSVSPGGSGHSRICRATPLTSTPASLPSTDWSSCGR